MGRVGGLAVALGIGAAVFTGAGVASADDGTGASASDSSAEASQSSQPVASSDGAMADEKAGDSSQSGAEEPAEDEPAEEEPVDAEPAEEEPVDEEPAEEEPVDEEPAGEEPVDAEPPVAEPLEPEEAPAVERPAAQAETDQTETVTRDISDQTAPDQPVADTAAPASPALASLVMSVLAAGREATDETPQSAGDQVGTSLAADEYPIPTDVVVEDFRPPFEWLQHIPVLGRFVVTPLVHLAHALPFVGEFLHPLIGWPVDHDAAPGDPKPRTVRVTSFDGAKIYVHFMPATGLKAGESAPTVLSGPGLGLPGATTLGIDIDGFLPNDVVGVGMLRKAGYNVVTWDPRGEWHSEGTMFLDSPDYEGRDVSHIISWLSTLDAVQKVDGDPKIGMVGASYGGGIQLAAAAIDRRIDAIVPTIAWNNLTDVLFPREAVNSGWGTLLPTVLALTLAREHPRIFPVAIAGVLFGHADPADIDLVESFGYQDQLAGITIPTLLIQGTVDTLFTLDQAHRNALELIAAGTTTKVLWYCGGHGACLSSFNDGEKVWGETLEWLDRYVKGDETVDPGAQFEWVNQHGEWFSSETYPAGSLGAPIEASSDDPKTIPFVPFIGGSGPNPLILLKGLVRTLVGLPSAAPALNAVNLTVPDATVETHIVGAPELTLTYSGTGTAKHVYAQIVDDETGLVLGNQATPIPVELDGQSHTATFSLEQVAHTLQPGQSVTVQIVTSTISFLNFYSWGNVTVEGMSVKLPTAIAAAASSAASSSEETVAA